VTQQTVARETNSVLVSAREAAPEFAVRFAGALMAVAVAAVHVADQGGITAMADPAWIGWGYRLIEVGGVLTALILLLPRQAWLRPGWPGWAAGALLGAAPFLAYIASRTMGVPGDHADAGNWGDWLGTVSLLAEAALVMLSVSMLLAARQRR
jgi:hypothetical protein